MPTPKYVVRERSLIGNEIFEEGATVEYDGLPAENLEPTCEVGRARYQEYLKTNADRLAKLAAAAPESAVGDAEKFAQALAAELAKSKQETAELVASVAASAVAQTFAQFFPDGVPTAKKAAKTKVEDPVPLTPPPDGAESLT